MELKSKYVKVLDDGFIGLVDYMGGDEDIEQAARVSYQKGTRQVTKTRGLLRYLMRHRHTTPFEMVEFKFHVRVPMDCWRQWIRHRTASVNEYSTRYSEAIDARQCTDPNEWRLQSGSNKQGSEGFLLADKHLVELNELPCPTWCFKDGKDLSYDERDFHKAAQELYDNRLKAGISREQARKDLPLSTYTEAYWKCDLKNILHFMSLRCDSHAQLEIRKYADVMAGMVKEICPITFDAWYDYHFQAVPFTLLDRKLLNHQAKADLYGVDIKLEEYAEEIGMSKREYGEYCDKIRLPEEKDFTLKEEDVKNYEEIKAD